MALRQAHKTKVGFLSFGHRTASPRSQTQTASDALLQSIDLTVAAEALGANGTFFRVHHYVVAIDGVHHAPHPRQLPVRRRQIRDHRAADGAAELPLLAMPQAAWRRV
jgi:hypothetical protein